MTVNEYQAFAARTMNIALTRHEALCHALSGMSAELGEVHSIYQKVYQGHQIVIEDLQKEVGDLLWMVAEFCTIQGWKMDDICQMNIDKLRARYPDGFSADRSVNRSDDDE